MAKARERLSFRFHEPIYGVNLPEGNVNGV